MFLDDSACNLASFNLLKFLTPGGQFDIAAYRHAIAIVTTAMEIIVDSAGYPTEMIAKNSHDYRPLGLGYANLGALLMAFGLPYDSDAGRDFAATLTAILCGDAYWQSAASPRPARRSAPPRPHPAGRRSHRRRLPRLLRQPRALPRRHPHAPRRSQQHRQVPQPAPSPSPSPSSTSSSPPPRRLGRRPRPRRAHGYRNSQVTVLAPTGTIGFMMDCDTTGIEPDLALVKYKKLVGGGMIKIVNNTVPSALIKLGYSESRSTPSSATSTPPAPSKARPASSPSTSPSSTAPSSPPRAPAASTTWATSR
jgi:ribonucleoside-diphosphate reductase alpha chain